MKKEKMKLKYKKGIFVTIVFIFGLYFGIGIYSIMDKNDSNAIMPSYEVQKKPLYLNSPNSIKLNLPAVNGNDSGVTAFLEVEVKEGSGLVLVNLENVLTNYDTQESVRSAADSAGKYLNKSLENVDIIYNIVADASILEGPSAGAALTIATVLALEGNPINDNIMITGTINHDLTIGPAGRVKAKAIAAKEIGSTVFLAPVGTSYDYNETEFCSDYGLFDNYCQIEYVPVSIEDIAGIKVVEVQTLDDALGWFRG